MKNLLRNKMLQMTAFLSLLYVAGSCLFVTQPLSAQIAGTGTIQGTVSDPSGRVIQGVSVKATNTATELSTATTSTAAGFYVLTALQPGEYIVVFSAPGFELFRQENVNVGPISTVGVNITLKVGSATAQVTVTTAPPALDTENGSIDSVLPADIYSTLPVPMSNGPKSPLAFAAMLPGVFNDVAPGGVAGYSQFYLLGGGIEGSSDVFMNGIAVPDVESGGSAGTVTTNPEDVETFQAITNGIPAYYTGVGVLNLVSKSGTNQFHGDAYENVRNTLFDSPGVFSLGVVPVEHQNEYGVSVGGPILKNRLFAYFNTDRYDLTTGATPSFITIPTTAERTGDFSAFPTPIYDPATTTCPTLSTCTRTQFPGNIIPSGRISSVSAVLGSAWPAVSNINLTNNYLSSETSGLSELR